MATNYDYIGKGELFAAVVTNGVPGGFYSLGNCSKASFSVSEESKELADFTSAGGGTKNKISRIKGVELSITAHDFSPENLEKALRANNIVVTAGAVTAEEQVAYKGALVPLDFLPNTLKTVTVTNDSATTTYTVNTDYVIKNAGLFIPETSTMVDGDTIKITYTKLAGNVIEALTNSGLEYQIVFSGLNEAQNGRPVSIRVFRAKFSPTSGLDALSDDFSSLELKSSVLADSSRVGTGLSQYMNVALASVLSAA